MREKAIKLCSILPELYSDDLDRKAMWERISNGVYSAVRKCGGDCEVFINSVLEFIKADPVRVMSNKNMYAMLKKLEEKPTEWHSQFLNVFTKKLNIILVYAREHWVEFRGKE